mgnify:CR=1 FL=1
MAGRVSTAGDSQLVLLDEARQRLAKVASVDEAKKIRDQAAALEHYGRQQRLSLDAVNKAGEIKVRAERRIGELLERVPRESVAQRGKRGGEARGKTPPASATPLQQACERAAISPDMAKDCQKLAAIPAPMFEAAITAMQTDEEVRHRGVSTAGMLRVYRESDESVESAVRRIDREVAA